MYLFSYLQENSRLSIQLKTTIPADCKEPYITGEADRSLLFFSVNARLGGVDGMGGWGVVEVRAKWLMH